MIGRNAPDEFMITPTSKHEAYSALTKVAEANMRRRASRRCAPQTPTGSDPTTPTSRSTSTSRWAFLFCDVHEDYHKATDTPDKIDYDKVRRICRLVMRMLEALQIDKPKF